MVFFCTVHVCPFVFFASLLYVFELGLTLLHAQLPHFGQGGVPIRLAPVFLCSFPMNSLNLETLLYFEPQQDLGAFLVLNLESVNFSRGHDGFFFKVRNDI